MRQGDRPSAADLRRRFPPPHRADRQPPNPGLVAYVEDELRRRSGRWGDLPGWVFWPAIRRVRHGATPGEAYEWAQRRLPSPPPPSLDTQRRLRELEALCLTLTPTRS